MFCCLVFLDSKVWVKNFKLFDFRFGFLIKNCVDFTPGTQKTPGGGEL